MRRLRERRREAGYTSKGYPYRGHGKFHPAIADAGITEARSQATLDRPPLKYIDVHGRVHREEELSAEELIRRYEAQQREEV